MGLEKKRFVAFKAYEKLADSYAELVDSKPHNAFLEMPATLSLLSDVEGKHKLSNVKFYTLDDLIDCLCEDCLNEVKGIES